MTKIIAFDLSIDNQEVLTLAVSLSQSNNANLVTSKTFQVSSIKDTIGNFKAWSASSKEYIPVRRSRFGSNQSTTEF